MILPGQKFDREQMFKLIKEKKNDHEIAKILGVSAQAIGVERRKLNLSIVKVSSLETAHRIVEKQLDVVDQLKNINKHTNEMLTDLRAKINNKPSKTTDIDGQKDARTLALDAIKEIRQQLALQMEVFKTLADYKVMQEFQKEVLDTIGSANKCPECGFEIVCEKCSKKIDFRTIIFNKLKAAKALRASVELTK
jgi:DNA-binding transcriptional regulator YiaG